jgi:hypothetical protein
MPFWKVSRATGSQLTEGSAARDLEPHLEPISVFTARGSFDGWIVAAEKRMTDLLNEHPNLRVCLDAATDHWETVDRDDILFVAPPERATDPQRRISRRRNRIVALVESFVVTGTAHVQPGATLDPYLLRRQVRFLPLTDAWVTHRTDPEVAFSRPVLIVNTMNLVELRSAMTVV